MQANKAQPATGASVWTASDMTSTKRWIYEVSNRDTAELEHALAHVQRQGLAIPFGKDQFPLDEFAQRLRELRREIEDGTGVVLMRGLPVDRYGLDGSRLLYWGLGAHLGIALAQAPRGELLIDVRDTGGDQYKDPTARGYHTHRRLPFHNDQGDVVGLLCLRGAKSGGLSCIASAAAVHNEILATRPDLLSVLYEPYYSDIRGEQPPALLCGAPVLDLARPAVLCTRPHLYRFGAALPGGAAPDRRHDRSHGADRYAGQQRTFPPRHGFQAG